MTLSPTQAWIDAFSVADVAPIVLVELTVNRRLFVAVDDFSVASGNEIQITVNTTTYTFIAGTTFVIGGSNESMAINAANAINIHTSNMFAAFATGSFIEIIVAQQATGIDLARTATTGASVAVTGSSMVVRPGAAPTTYKFVSGSRPFLNGSSVYTNSIDKVGAVGASVDPVTRKYSAGSLDITWIDDGRLRDLIYKYPTRSAAVAIYLGTLDITEANFLKVATLKVKDIVPIRGEHKLRMQLEDIMWFIGSKTWKGQIIAKHPLTAIEYVLDAVNAIDGADYDSASLDPVATTPTTAHHTVSRLKLHEYPRPAFASAIVQPTEVSEIVADLCVLTGGTWLPNASGVYRHDVYDDTIANARTLAAGPNTGHDCEIVDVRSHVENLINTVTVTYGHTEDLDPLSFVLADDDSVNQFGEFRYDIESHWLSEIGVISSGTSFGAYFTLAGAIAGFAGCGGLSVGSPVLAIPTVDQTTGYQLTSARRAVFMLYTIFATGTAREYVACNEIQGYNYQSAGYETPFNNVQDSLAARRTYTDGSQLAVGDTVRCYIDGSYSSDGFTSGRAGFGTNAQTWGSWTSAAGRLVYVADVTIVWEIAKRILRRFKFGCPRVVVRCSLRHADLELGDFVALSGDDTMIRWRHNGAESTTKWEIVRKDIDLIGATPHVELELAWAKDSWVPALSAVPAPTLGHLPTSGGGTDLETITDNALTPVYTDDNGDGLQDTPVTRI
mgnify:CR=1 FL=1